MTPEFPGVGFPTQETDKPREVFWDYADVAVFIGLAFPALLISAVVARALAPILPVSKEFDALLMQLLWYVLVFAALNFLLRVRYQRPFWSSLGWRFPFRGEVACLVAGPVVAIAVGLIGYIIRTPIIKLPLFDQMLKDRPTRILFTIFVVMLGPLCEELAFRGFFMPLLIRSFGVATGIGITALLFGAMHGYEYEWSWRHILLISLVGVVLGWTRYKTRSTAGSTFMHATFNLTQLAAFLAQPK